MLISAQNPFANRIIALDYEGKVIDRLAHIDLYTFKAKHIDGRDIEVAEIVIVHPTGRKLSGNNYANGS